MELIITVFLLLYFWSSCRFVYTLLQYCSVQLPCLHRKCVCSIARRIQTFHTCVCVCSYTLSIERILCHIFLSLKNENRVCSIWKCFSIHPVPFYMAGTYVCCMSLSDTKEPLRQFLLMIPNAWHSKPLHPPNHIRFKIVEFLKQFWCLSVCLFRRRMTFCWLSVCLFRESVKFEL